MVLAMVVLVVGNLAISEIVRRCANGGIGRNQLVGLRTSMIMATDECWQAGHRAALPWVFRGTGLSFVLVVLAIFVRSDNGQAGVVLVSTAALLAGVIIGAVAGQLSAGELLAQ